MSSIRAAQTTSRTCGNMFKCQPYLWRNSCCQTAPLDAVRHETRPQAARTTLPSSSPSSPNLPASAPISSVPASTPPNAGFTGSAVGAQSASRSSVPDMASHEITHEVLRGVQELAGRVVRTSSAGGKAGPRMLVQPVPVRVPVRQQARMLHSGPGGPKLLGPKLL